jgi:CarD family transcriptional regulator
MPSTKTTKRGSKTSGKTEPRTRKAPAQAKAVSRASATRSSRPKSAKSGAKPASARKSADRRGAGKTPAKTAAKAVSKSAKTRDAKAAAAKVKAAAAAKAKAAAAAKAKAAAVRAKAAAAAKAITKKTVTKSKAEVNETSAKIKMPLETRSTGPQGLGPIETQTAATSAVTGGVHAASRTSVKPIGSPAPEGPAVLQRPVTPAATIAPAATESKSAPAPVMQPRALSEANNVNKIKEAIVGKPATAPLRPAGAPQLAPQRPHGRPGALIIKPPARPPGMKISFKPNEYIVYPAHGVGQIVAVEEQEVAGFKLELFVISFIKDKMILKVPTPKVVSVGMRKLAEGPVVEKALTTLTGRARVKRTMWSRRAQEYEAKINSGDLGAIAEVVRDLYRSDAQPEQSYSERQLFEAAIDRMGREIAIVRKLTEQEAFKLIEAQLQKGPRRGTEKSEAEGGEPDVEGDVDEAA